MEGVGEVFTPLPWGRWAVREFGLLRPWREGASVLDPTMGDGALLEALILEGIAEGASPADLPTDRLYGVETNPRHIAAFLGRMRRDYGLELSPENFTAGDILSPRASPVCDILFGNPPWSTFADLPMAYKNAIKDKFLEYGLVENRRRVLLGGSRAEFAGLVVLKAVAENLRPRGRAVFFLPLSLFRDGGANARFRLGRAGGADFAVERIVDLTAENVFPGVATRYGIALLNRDAERKPPESLGRMEKGATRRGLPGPPAGDGGWGDGGWEPIPIDAESRPRQGVNTCGANDVFFFDEKGAAGDGGCLVSNRSRKVSLPEKYVFPLASAANFRQDRPEPEKWVLLPYTREGKPLPREEIGREPLLEEYLRGEKARLDNRKGVMIRSWIERGYFWALLGVGPYSFRPWKIIWEAYGRREWRPKIFDGSWQANQALQCGMSFSRRDDCRRVFDRLSDERVERYLLSYGGEGGMNWAQPGKIQKLLSM